jgi:DNA (cytosine-5)-methyltransferase 1
VNETNVPLTVAEYFAGIGLVRMGLAPVGWRVIWANDISQQKNEMYRAFYPEDADHYIIDDIFNINPTLVPVTTLATCSFPCVDLSLAGNMNGMNGNHSSAFWGFINILRAQGQEAPPLLLIENVPGWLYSNNGTDFRLTIKALNELGYACDVIALDGLRFMPQSRLRVFVIGVRCQVNNNEAERDAILERPKSLLSSRLRESISSSQDLQWVYISLPNPPPLHTNGFSDIVEEITEFDSRWWDCSKVNYHLEMMDSSHYERVAALVQGSTISYRTFFRRVRKGRQRAEVRSDDIAGCLRTATGGSGKQFLIRAGQGSVKMRALTPREYARLQGVPDNFIITVNGVQALNGFGDAVCVPAITWIAEHALAPLIAKLGVQ